MSEGKSPLTEPKIHIGKFESRADVAKEEAPLFPNKCVGLLQLRDTWENEIDEKARAKIFTSINQVISSPKVCNSPLIILIVNNEPDST